jgi:hypothetical protein
MRIRVGPLLCCGCIGLARAVWLSDQLSGITTSEIGFLLLADLPVLSVLAILAWLETRLERGWRAIPLLLTAGLVLVYTIDVSTVVALNARLHLDDIRRFAVESWLLPAFLSATLVATFAVLAASFLLRVSVPLGAARAAAIAVGGFLVLPGALSDRIPSHLQKYTGSVLLLGNELWARSTQPAMQYRPGDFAAFGAEYDALFDAPIAQSGRDIVLVIVESLSAADSERTSGIGRMLTRFDALSRHGTLFRNVFANFEASEGGIVSLLSGVPPLHFPTASTNTFWEYALQRSMVATFRRHGYRCEFLTSVPLDFLSMEAYVRSPSVGFTRGAGQKEIARFKGAPTYAFKSPADRVLYEELLARIDDRRSNGGEPLLVAAVTASSHYPYVDPLGRGDSEEHAWGYVQEELWWLYRQLESRRFFDHGGLLVITGDHRKMTPVSEQERERFGESAKARVPLLLIGNGVPSDRVDDRLWQQADILRMLDRALVPDLPLSPFAIWVERYVFVFGVASNAGQAEVFHADNQGRQAFKLHMQGTELDWITRPPQAGRVERRIHLQRSLQQARRASIVRPRQVAFGRELEPDHGSRGLLIGISGEPDVGRDPDATQGGRKLLRSDSLSLDRLRERGEIGEAPFALSGRAFLPVEQEGSYWFSMFADEEGCLAIDKQIVLGCQKGLNEGEVFLSQGLHRVDLRFVRYDQKEVLRLQWLPPGARGFVDFPIDRLLLPRD